MSKKIFLSVVIVAIVTLVYFVFFGAPQQERIVELDFVEDEAYALGFEYTSGQDGYELIESTTSDDFLQSYVMVQKADLVEYQNNEVDIAPPTMSIFVFQFPEVAATDDEQSGRITRLQNWAQSNAGLTAFGQIYGTPDIVELDGVKALEYTTDGVYQQSIFLVGYRGFIYMFVGQYDRPTDFIKKDFETLLESVRFE